MTATRGERVAWGPPALLDRAGSVFQQAPLNEEALLTADLPVMQGRTRGLLGFAQLFSFLLLDLSAPHLEALLFGLVTAASSLFYFVIADLSDPVGGFWSVEPAVTERATLELRLKRERPDAGTRVLPASVGSSRNIRI